jgi:membrane protease YdiL (CAAX protease family)
MITKQYNKPLLFYILSTAIPWVFWFIAAHYSHSLPKELNWIVSIVGFLGLLAPFIIALILMSKNKEVFLDFRNRFFNLNKVNIKYIFITCFLMLGSILLAQLISLAFGYSTNQFIITGSYTFTSGIFPVWFLLIIAPLIEELAWHSYGTDALRQRFNLFKTSIIFALFWGLWHLPLSFIKDYYQSNLVESGVIYSINFIVSLFPFVLIMNWLYYKSNRNILIPIIFHITAGYFNEIFSTHPMSKVIQTGLLIILSIYMISKDKQFFFKLKNNYKIN